METQDVEYIRSAVARREMKSMCTSKAAQMRRRENWNCSTNSEILSAKTGRNGMWEKMDWGCKVDTKELEVLTQETVTDRNHGKAGHIWGDSESDSLSPLGC